MQSAYPLIGLLAWLQFKHFVADYLLQPAWILRGKGNLFHPGGYAHAALHALATVPALVLVGLDAAWISALILGEFSLHFAIDHLKAVHARGNPSPTTARAYWAAHGADQLLHHMTYTSILMLVGYALEGA